MPSQSARSVFSPSPTIGPSGSAIPPVIASRMQTALARRTWSMASLDGFSRCQVFLVVNGEATFAGDDGMILELTAPFMLWLPQLTPGEFRLPAGSNGVVASIAESFVLRTVGDS